MNKKNNETTLTHLTKRFVKLLNSNEERVINLNEASTRLSVAKRRIYDITNVLEGIGLLQKTSKNVTRWVDCPRDSPFAAPTETPTRTVSHTDNNDNTTIINGNPSMTTPQIPGINYNGLPDAELLTLIQTYQQLDDCISQLESSRRQQLSGEEAYVTYHDFKSASFNDDQIVIAVHGPSDSRLDVNEHFQINIRTCQQGEKIEVYLYSNEHLSQSSDNNLQHVLNTHTNVGTPQGQSYASVSNDEGRGMSIQPTTSGVTSDTDHLYPDDPTFSSASAMYSEEDPDDPFTPLVPFDAHEGGEYTYLFDQDVTALFPDDNPGLF